jgi:hypothetical protein
MRFPIDPPPPLSVIDNPYEIPETAGIKALRPLGPSPQQELIVRPHYNPEPEPEQRQAGEDTRKNEDRRQADRRQYVQSVTVDTRLGRDRRHARRRPDDPPASSIDEKA